MAGFCRVLAETIPGVSRGAWCQEASTRGMSKPPAGRGHAHKHAGSHSSKHTHQKRHSKHHPGRNPKPTGGGSQGPPVHVVAHHHKAATTRGWSPGTDVACCAAEAFGTLVTASGRPWRHEQTLALYWSTPGADDTGASVLATLETARRQMPSAPVYFERVRPFTAAPLILGVVLPEPHAVAVTPDGTWWSWGEPFYPCCWPELVVEEAWAVQWQ